MNVISRYAFLMVGLCAACGAESGENVGEVAQAAASDLDVDFSGCSELAGIGLVPAANARALVPSSYALAGDSTNAVMVVRNVKCSGISVDGKPAKSGIVTQIGITLQGPDTTASINNYTLWYVTDLGVLHAKLSGAGAPAENSNKLSFTLTPSGSGGQLDFVADPKAPHHEMHGPVVTPTAAPTQFIASWWAGSGASRVRMRTTLPSIQFGEAHMTLTTTAGSALAQLIGGTSMTFAVLDSYNTFPAAHMEVRAAP
ncbi:MAG: hypothetical protein QM756_42565 [Polyangiaceae bacterium]